MTTSGLTSPSTPLAITQPDPAALRGPLLELWRRNLPTASTSRFDWLYGSRRAQAWLLGNDDQPAAGAAGLMLRRMTVAGQSMEGGGAIDLNVDRSQRSVGPALSLVRAVVASADAEGRRLLYGMPNRTAAAVMKRAGYRELGQFASWTRILDTEEKLRDRLHSPALGKFAAPMANAALRLLSGDWYRRLPAGVVSQSLHAFDERFDRLSARVAGQFDVIGERTADFLTWRFTDCPDVKYEIFALVETATNELAGYIVWYVDEGGVSISDLLAVDLPMTRLLLAEFTRLARRTGASAIRFNCFSSTRFDGLLRDAGFHHRGNRHPVLCRSHAALGPVPDSNWYLTMADSDTDV